MAIPLKAKNTQKSREEKMKKTNEKTETKMSGISKIVGAPCEDIDCHVHGGLKTRGRTFKGVVISKHTKRVAIEFERMIYVRKYERYAKEKTKLHARLPRCMEDAINVGDTIVIQECRPLSKIIHFAVIEKLASRKDASLNEEKEKKK